MAGKPTNFRLIDPLNPPPQDGEFSRLAPIVRESATWFFCDPATVAMADAFRSVNSFRLIEVDEALMGAQHLLAERGGRAGVAPAASDRDLPTRGHDLVDLFCDRFIARKLPYQLTVSSGRTIGQRQVLCAEALSHCEKAALAIRDGRRDEVCSLMRNLLN